MRDHAASSSSSSPMRVLFTIGAAGSLSDGELLDRFLDSRADEAEAAFGLIVERHGPMVRHVCLSILRNPDDAADAFQATFLVLARRARTIRARDSVGPWLFGVARRVALRARSAADRRRLAEHAKAELDAPRLVVDDPADSPSADDWSSLYEELDRLPARYRSPLVLCHLEGLTHEQAASRLGCPIGTLRTRLARGRDRLRSRLLRRGYSPASVAPLLLSPASLPNAPMALASIGWASTATRIAVASRGLSLASLSVPLASATLRSMSMIAFVRSLALGGVALSALGLGAGATGFHPWGDRGQTPEPEPSLTALPDPAPIPPPVALPPDEDEAPAEAPPDEILVRTPETYWSRVESLPLPDGAAVKEGDVIAELVYTITIFIGKSNPDEGPRERALERYQQAALDSELAATELRHYTEGQFPMEAAAAEADVRITHAEHELTKQRLEHLEELAEAGKAGKLEVAEAEVGLLRAEAALEKAQRALEVLTEFTRPHEERVREVALSRAHALEKDAHERYTQEEESLTTLIQRNREQITSFLANNQHMIEKAPYKEPDEPRDEMEQAGLMTFRRMRLTAPASGILRHEEPASVGEVVVPNEPLFRIEPAPEPEAPPQAPE